MVGWLLKTAIGLGLCAREPAVYGILRNSLKALLHHAFFQAISGPRSFPPVLREKALRFQVRIRAMPFIGGQPLPRRLLTCPALTAHGLGSPRSDECLKTTVDRWVP